MIKQTPRDTQKAVLIAEYVIIEPCKEEMYKEEPIKLRSWKNKQTNILLRIMIPALQHTRMTIGRAYHKKMRIRTNLGMTGTSRPCSNHAALPGLAELSPHQTQSSPADSCQTEEAHTRPS